MTNENKFPGNQPRDESNSGGFPLDASLETKLRRSAVYQFLMRECLSIHVGALRDIEQHWGLDIADVDRLGIASAPTGATNLIAANACAEKFGDLACC